MYDILVIQTKGFTAKVNFTYDRIQLLAALFEPNIMIKKNIMNDAI